MTILGLDGYTISGAFLVLCAVLMMLPSVITWVLDGPDSADDQGGERR